jgi:hypothetical protein
MVLGVSGRSRGSQAIAAHGQGIGVRLPPRPVRPMRIMLSR